MVNAVRIVDVDANPDDDDAYPVRDDIRTGESGQGYVLRMVRANFLTGLAEIRRRLGKHFSTTLTTTDAPFLSQWFGADLSKLKQMLEEANDVGGDGLLKEDGMTSYAGQTLGWGNLNGHGLRAGGHPGGV